MAQNHGSTVDSEMTLVVGAGLSGSVIARRLVEEKNRRVVVIDKRTHVGGNCFDEKMDGITIHRYGAHIFHTDDAKVWQWLSRFTAWHDYTHHVQALVQGQLIPLPFNLNSLDLCFPPEEVASITAALERNFAPGERVTILQLGQTADPTLKKLADYIYEHVFLHYTLKQWECKLEDLDACVAERVPVVFARDDRYFVNKFQGIPADGYTELVESILDHPQIMVMLKTKYVDIQSLPFREIYYTGPIDEFFDFTYGELPYRSLQFVTKKYSQEFFQPVSVVNYPETEKFTRIIEHKYFLGETAPVTMVTREYPTRFVRHHNERYYPVQNAQNEKLYQKYRQLAATQLTVHFLGRLGDYRYYDMDQAVARALAYNLDGQE